MLIPSGREVTYTMLGHLIRVRSVWVGSGCIDLYGVTYKSDGLLIIHWGFMDYWVQL